MNVIPEAPIVCIMGPTASGKTDLALQLVKHFPFEIISVDSAMVYTQMDIGTAKPAAEILQDAPHRLINLIDPKKSYSAGRFKEDVLREISIIKAAQRLPLLVGGTMMYFKILQQGIADLPVADTQLRSEFDKKVKQFGVEYLHAELQKIDRVAAMRIKPTDKQRIQRALEVFKITGKRLSELQVVNQTHDLNFLNIGLLPADRKSLHAKIAARFMQMIAQGFIAEVEKLYKRGDLSADLPAIRSIGYAQIWNYLAGKITYDEMCEQAIAATRQLAKRQMTWLRSWPAINLFDSESPDLYAQVRSLLRAELGAWH